MLNRLDSPIPGALHEPALNAVFEPFRAGTPDRPFVVAQIGQSLDGRIATLSGESKYINGAAALDHLHTIRAHVDAVVVGVGTVVADDPLLSVRRVPGRSPARIVIDPSGRLPRHARCLAGDAPCYVVCAEDAPAPRNAEPIRLPDRNGTLCPRAIVAALGRRGFSRILVEGGARTLAGFIDSGQVDRMHILVSPVLIGSGKPALELKPISALADALRPDTRVYVLPGSDVLFDCDLQSVKGRHS